MGAEVIVRKVGAAINDLGRTKAWAEVPKSSQPGTQVVTCNRERS